MNERGGGVKKSYLRLSMMIPDLIHITTPTKIRCIYFDLNHRISTIGSTQNNYLLINNNAYSNIAFLLTFEMKVLSTIFN